MASASTINNQTVSVDGYPPHTRTLDLLMGVLSFVLMAGLFIDGWAHNRGIVDESFFTPYHAVMYGSYALFGFTLVGMHYRNVGKGHRFMKALPQGYMLSLIGVFIFAIGGLGDMLWHIAFGIEDGIEALYSPTHLILAIGYCTVLVGVLMSAWVRQDLKSNWHDLGWVLLTATCLLSIFTFFTQHLHFVTNFEGILSQPIGSDNQEALTTAVLSSYIIVTSLMIGLVLLLIKRWRLPSGAITFIFTLNSLLMGLMLILDFDSMDFVTFLLLMLLMTAPTLITGIIGDVMIWRMKISHNTPKLIRVVATVMGVLLGGLYLSAIAILGVIDGGSFWWEIHTLAGIPTLTGLTGFLLSILVFPPQMPHELVDTDYS